MIIVEDKLEWPEWLKGGYEWRDHENGRGEIEPHLVVPAWADTYVQAAPRTYKPMMNPTLPQKLRDTDPSKEGIIKFAESYGHLGVADIQPQEGEYDPNYMRGEPLSAWVDEIKSVRHVFSTWRKLQLGETRGSSDNIAFGTRREEDWARLKPGESGDPNNPLDFNTAISLSNSNNLGAARLSEIAGTLEQALVDSFWPEIIISDDVSGLNFCLSPRNLRAAIWVQLARLFAPENRWKLCGYCGDLFEAKSLKAQYCKQSHQQMAHRKRKAQEATK